MYAFFIAAYQSGHPKRASLTSPFDDASMQTVGSEVQMILQRSSCFVLKCMSTMLVLDSCILSVDSDRRQCTVNADCTKRGASFAGTVCVNTLCEIEPAWGCLDRAPRASELAPGPFEVALHLQDIATEAPMSGVTATLCRKRDQQCADPASAVTSDADGTLILNVPAGAATSFALLTRADLIPSLYFFSPPLGTDHTPSTTELFTRTTARLLAKQLGADLAGDSGLVALSAHDCGDDVAQGVRFASDDDASLRFYAADGLPDGSAPSTNFTGFGGFANVRPGSITVSAEVEALRRPLATLNLLVWPGSITYSSVVPLGN